MASATFDVNNVAAEAITFILTSQDKKSVAYMAPTSSLAEPIRSGVSVDLRPNGSKGSDRVTLDFSHTVINSQALPVTGRVSVMFVVPRDTAVTSAHMLDLVSFVTSRLTAPNVALLLDGIAP